MIQSITDGESTYTDEYFIQTADLDFTGVSYIVNEMNSFDGIYNGQGYILKNLAVNAEFGNDPYLEGNEYLAPFDKVSGILMNVGVEASSVEEAYVGGGLARRVNDDAVIINCWYGGNALAGSSYNSDYAILTMCYYLDGTTMGRVPSAIMKQLLM